MSRRMRETMLVAVVATMTSMLWTPRLEAQYSIPSYNVPYGEYVIPSGPLSSCVEHPDVWRLRNHPDFQMLQTLLWLDGSTRGLDGQCRTGRDEILYKLTSLRDSNSWLFDEIDFGPVEIATGTNVDHYGVSLYLKGPAGESPEDAAKRGVIFEYTNYLSNMTGDYRTVRSWCDFTRDGTLRAIVSDMRHNNHHGPDDDVIPYFGNYPPLPIRPLVGPMSVPPPTCIPTKKEIVNSVLVVTSQDPNDKAGSPGAAAARYISGEEPLRYAVFFENVETATAPAQEVVVTDQLDPATMDLATVRLGTMSFGSRRVEPPVGLTEFTTDVDLRPDRELLVRIAARLDAGTGLLTWRLASLDPATGLPPEDPSAGFLPPNLTPPEGEGSVIFTVMPRAGLLTGTEIRNRATIVFDANPAIDTPAWLNTIDNGPPASRVSALAPRQTTASFGVTWSGADVGAGIQDYTVFVSDDGGAFVPWLRNTPATSATFAGQTGRSYAFYSVARDLVGDVEVKSAGAEASTTVRVPIRGDIDDDGDVDNGDLTILLRDRGKTVAGSQCGTLCDLNGDGKIDALDSRILTTLCTRPRCATR